MELKQASQIQFADYTIHPEFRKLCDFAESLDIGISDEFLYRARDGTKQGLDILIRQAAWADKKRKGIEETVSLPFVLSYLDEGFIPVKVSINEAIELAKKYQSKFGVAIDETTAMAAVLLVTIGYEQKKLCILHLMAKGHNDKVARSGDFSAPRRGVAPVHLYKKYHVDLLEMVKCRVTQGYQLERNHNYFEILQYRKQADGISQRRKELLNDNRIRLNQFLDDFPGRPMSFLTYYERPNGRVRVLLYGPYTRVKPIQT